MRKFSLIGKITIVNALVSSLLPSAMKLRQGNIFTSVCQEFCPRGKRLGVSTSVHAGIHNPLDRHPPGRHPGQTPPGQTPSLGRYHHQADTPAHTLHRQTPPGQTPPADSYCSGWYAFYWNTFLFVYKMSVRYVRVSN